MAVRGEGLVDDGDQFGDRKRRDVKIDAHYNHVQGILKTVHALIAHGLVVIPNSVRRGAGQF